MATKSDFAQKLLHDLRRRKEQMAAAQYTGNSHTTSRDANAHAGRFSQGSQQIKAIESDGSEIGNSQRSSSSNRSFHIQESSGEVAKMNSSGNNPMLSFLHRLTSFQKYHPSNVHATEISKGAEKLNQIQRACSNGVSFDKYSTEVGKELLKGAMDLEESLRMLVNLQEASEYMMSPERKNQIMLLEGDEEDTNAKVANQKRRDLPRFSFDEPCRNSNSNQETVKTEMKQQLLAVAYQQETANQIEKQPSQTSNLVSHRRSSSCTDFAAQSANLELKNQSNSSTSGAGKGRLSDVIVKLMGLDELPQSAADAKAFRRESTSKKNVNSVNPTNADSVNEKNMQSKNVKPTQETKAQLKDDKAFASRNNGFVTVSSDIISCKDLNVAVNENTGSRSTMAAPQIDKWESNMKEQEKTITENASIQTRETHASSESISESEPQPKLALKHKMESVDYKKGTVQIENKTFDRILLDNQQKPKDIIEVTGDNKQANQKEQHLSKQKLQVNKHKGRQAEPTISQTVRNKAHSLLEKQFPVNQASHGKKSITKSITGKDGSSIGPTVTMGSFENRNENQNALPKKLASRTREGFGTHTLVRRKPIKVPSAEKKENYFQIHRKGDFCKIDGSSRKGTPQHMERSLGKQSAIFKVTKQPSHDMAKHTGTEGKLSQDKSEEAKQNITRIHKSEVSSEPLNSAQELHGETKESSYISRENDCQNMEAPISSGNQKDIAPKLDEITIYQQDAEPPPVFGLDSGLKYQKILPHHSSGNYYANNKSCKVFQDEQGRFVPIKFPENQQGRVKICSVIQKEHTRVFSSEVQESLTEPEKRLKELLVTSQLFLVTIEALFKLNIPISILQTNDPNSKNSEFKLKLHCSYEVVKRKARRQKLLNHPYAKISMGCIKVRSLDDLIKQLCKGFDMLSSYGSRGSENCHTAADYLHTMLEKDIQNRHPDLNSMWDFGWDTMMSTPQEKDDIIRDVEKHLLNGLLDEIALDLLQITVSA